MQVSISENAYEVVRLVVRFVHARTGRHMSLETTTQQGWVADHIETWKRREWMDIYDVLQYPQGYCSVSYPNLSDL